MAGQLVPSGVGSNFAQQGSVDWVALSGSTLSFSIDVLSRFSKAGVEMITVAVGQAMCGSFNIPAAGQKRLSEAIARLKAFSSYGKVLWFGFGVKSVVRTLCETEQGAACAAICACLSVSYDAYFSSQVLRALAEGHSAPRPLTPALSQWAALMNVCAGAVTDSKFPLRVQGFSNIFDLRDQNPRKLALQEATNAVALANALLELMKVSRGTVRNITIEGGVDCGWLAAIAEWLLDLRVSIVDQDGQLLYLQAHNTGDSHAQVTFIRQSSIRLGEPQVRLLARAYCVPRGHLCFHINRDTCAESPGGQHFFSKGRSEWSSILHDTFGTAVDILTHPRNIGYLATSLCSGLPIIHDNSQSLDYLNPWGQTHFTNNIEMQYHFIAFVSKQLPELEGLQYLLQEIKGSPDKSFGWAEGNLKQICSCGTCRQARNGLDLGSNENSEFSYICLEKMAITIFEFLWILSRLEIDDAIRPSSSGLAMLYYNPENPQDPERRLPRSSIRYAANNRGMNKTLFSLFTGLSDMGQEDATGISAFCGSGICMYLPNLQDPALPPNCQLRIRIISGCIERDGSIYSQVSDTPQHDGWKPLPLPPAPSTYGKTFGATPELQLIVEETLSSRLLHATFHVSGSSLLSWQLTYQEQQQWNPQGPLTTSVDTARKFGAYALVQKLRRRIRFNPCLRKDVKITCGHNEDQSPRVVWDGECNKTEAVLWPGPSLDNINCPKQEEWVVVQCRRSEVEILRANFSLLYSVICLTEDATTKAADIILTYKRHCLVCLGVTDVLSNGNIARKISPTPLVVHSFLRSPDSRVELFDGLEVKNSDSGFVPGSMPRTKPAHEMR